MRVPTYDSPQVESAPMFGEKIEADRSGDRALQVADVFASGSNLVDRIAAAKSRAAGMVEKAEAQAADAAAKEQNQRDADRLFQAESGLKADAAGFDSTMRERQGQYAWDVSKDALEFWDKAIAQRSSDLENPRQKQLFTKTATQLRLAGLSTATAWERQQRDISIEQSAKASIAGSIDLAASDVAYIPQARTDITDRIAVLTHHNGWTPEIVAAETSSALTKLHSQVVQSLVDKQPDAAAAYFDAHKDEIAGSQRDAVDKMVRTGTVRQQAQTATDSIMTQRLSRSAALQAARSKYSGDLEDEVVQRISARYNEQDAAREHGERQVADAAWKHFADSEGKLEAIPASTWATLDGKTKLALQAAARKDDSSTVTDWSRYADLKDQAVSSPADFAKRDLRQNFPDLAPTQRKELIDLQAAARSPEGRADVVSVSSQLANAHDLMGISGTDKQKARGKFDSMASQMIDAEGQQLKRKPTYEERQKIIDRLMVEGTVPGLIFDHDVRLYEADPNKTFTPNIPDVDRKAIVNRAAQQGRTLSEQQILATWRKWRGV